MKGSSVPSIFLNAAVADKTWALNYDPLGVPTMARFSLSPLFQLGTGTGRKAKNTRSSVRSSVFGLCDRLLGILSASVFETLRCVACYRPNGNAIMEK